MTFEPARIFAVLNTHDVRYVVIGGMAARYQGSQLLTEDIDVTPEREFDNLERLAAALKDLGARFLDPAGQIIEDVEVPLEAELLNRMASVRTLTRFGILDLVFRPDGTEGYPDLVRRARYVVVAGVAAPVAAIEDVIRSKAAAGRDKDLAAMEDLTELAAALRVRRGSAMPVDPTRFIDD